MRLFWTRLFLIGAFVAPCTNVKASDAAFLDRSIETGLTKVSSYQDIIDFAGIKSGKPAEPSELLRRWIALGGKLNSYTAFGKGTSTLRSYLDRLTMMTDLTWHYDAARDVLVFDFAWHRTDERSSSILLAEVLSSSPPPLDYGLRSHMADDTWRQAFDALISKNEDTSDAWLVRARSNAAVPILLNPGAVTHLCAGTIHDGNGQELKLVVNHQHMQMSPGEGSASYYLFDKNGKFLNGGVFSTGNRVSDVTGRILADKTLEIKGWFNGREPTSKEYTVQDGKLTFKAARSPCQPAFTASSKPFTAPTEVRLSMEAKALPGL